eukprot:s7483_g4.t3
MHMALHSAALLRGAAESKAEEGCQRNRQQPGCGLPQLEEPTRSMCIDVVTNHAVPQLWGLPVRCVGCRGSQKAKAKVVNILQPKEKCPQFAHPVEILVQAARQRTPSARRSSRPSGARLSTATTINETVHFSSISVYMGQGGSGPGTRASGLMVDKPVWERHQGINEYSTTVPWGAIGEIGLRKKLIGPADTSFLMKLARRIGLGACRAARPSWSESTSETG